MCNYDFPLGSKPKVNGAEGQPNQEKEKEYKSDAILSCPACMITVCIDCQRYVLYIELPCVQLVMLMQYVPAGKKLEIINQAVEFLLCKKISVKEGADFLFCSSRISHGYSFPWKIAFKNSKTR